MKVAVTGGGTGGHTLPVLAVIKSLEKINPETKVFFVGSRFGLEAQLIPKMGVRYYGISTGKFRRYHKSLFLNIIDLSTLFKNIKDFFRFLSGFREARKILKYEKPDVVFAKGGFVSLPVGLAARFAKIPVVIHESDTVMGMANRMMSKFAAKIAVTFPVETFNDINPDIIVQTGNPVREDLLLGDRDKTIRELGFKPDIKTLLVIGGSQGSLFINETLAEIMPDLLEEFQVIWIVGERDYDLVNLRIEDIPKEKQKKLKLFGFVTSEMAGLYAACDLAISRPGSNILFELAALGKPAILIPPSAEIASGHQFENARYFSRNGASLVIKQSEVTSKKLLRHIQRLLGDSDELKFMSEKTKSLSHPDAAAAIAELVYQTGENHIEQTRKTEGK